ncbi:hypothetical protein MSAN_01933200 [Mycena sanguinolenta]|uniref:CBS domain-containing protein n=1 Tax=Mycena sanguinolenta TaxID=230812 RepID=A0A8H6XNG2_9AGAR|nr:hypothetical protein MSAN_01933200 [Mycena sanguinolenta]
MAASKRMSQSFTMDPSPVVTDEPDDAQQWVEDWRNILAKDLIDSRIVEVDAETSVEDACEILLSENTVCLAVKATEAGEQPYLGLFDWGDVNAFLTLAASRQTLSREYLLENPRVDAIVSAARAGHVSIRLVSNLSEKNPLETVSESASIIALLEIFSRGAHRVLIRSSDPSSGPFLGIVSDRRLLTWFADYTPMAAFLETPLHSLSLPSLQLFSAVITATSSSSVLDAMRLMSEEGVSSVAVLDDDSRALLSAVSVTDVGRIVVPSQSKQILSTPLQQFIALIKAPDGSTDGADRYPVYAVSTTSLLSYTIQKLLATNSHRLFITRDTSGSASPIFASPLSGVVSIVDILSLFARLAHLDVDPGRMQRHRRASSASANSTHSASGRSASSHRSSTDVRLNRTPSLRTSTGMDGGGTSGGNGPSK